MRKFFIYTILFLGTIVILATFGSVVTSGHWWIKVLDFPRIQLLLAALILLAAFVWLKRERDFRNAFFVFGLLTAIGIQLYYIYPYLDFVEPTVEQVSPVEEYEKSTFDLVVANIYIHNKQVEEFLQILQDVDPDMVLAIETDAWWEKALQPLDEQYPYGMEYPLNNGYGMILYSRFPLFREEVKFLNYKKVPSFHTLVRLPGGELFWFHGIHPVPPLPGGFGDEGGKKETLRKIGEMAETHSLPAIVAGDLNNVTWARREKLFGQGGLFKDVRVGRGIISTFNAKSPIIRWPLDYVYVTEEFGVVGLRRLREFGSDHFPLYVELSLLEKRDSRE